MTRVAGYETAHIDGINRDVRSVADIDGRGDFGGQFVIQRKSSG